MHVIKGSGESHSQRMMNKALGTSKEQAENLTDNRGGRGKIEPTVIPRMTTAQKQQQAAMRGPNKDWSHSSNRIALGAPVYMKSKTNVDAEFEDRGHEEEHKQEKPDALADGRLDGLSDEDDDEFGEGGENSAVAAWRAARLAEIKKTTSRTNEFLGMGHGSYSEIVQDDFLKEVTKSKYVVCHFYHPEYQHCKLVDKHLESLARKHLATKWIKIDANKAPFFVTKLQIKMLPTLVFFKDGIARDRMIGLDDMGEAGESFTTTQLEKRIEKAGVIITGDKQDEEELEKKNRTQHSIRQSTHNKDQESEDEDD